MDLGLRERVAIVTGASRGIGRQVALDLAAEGCHVLLCARDAAALESVAAEIGGRGGHAVSMVVDVAESGAAGAIVEECRRIFGRLDVLINNAGGAQPRRLEALTDADWRNAFEVNFFAAARLSIACASVMSVAGWGRLVHVASTNGREPDPLFAPYSAAKSALINLSTSLAQAFSADGVLSNCVIPGVTLTELVEANAASTADRTGATPSEVMDKLLAKKNVPAGRFGTPDEVSAAILFLASEQASWITGASLAVDGGTLRSG